MESRVHWLDWLIREQQGSVSLCLPVLGLQVCTITSAFSHGCWRSDLILGPHNYSASTLPTNLSTQGRASVYKVTNSWDWGWNWSSCHHCWEQFFLLMLLLCLSQGDTWIRLRFQVFFQCGIYLLCVFIAKSFHSFILWTYLLPTLDP